MNFWLYTYLYKYIYIYILYMSRKTLKMEIPLLVVAIRIKNLRSQFYLYYCTKRLQMFPLIPLCLWAYAHGGRGLIQKNRLISFSKPSLKLSSVIGFLSIAVIKGSVHVFLCWTYVKSPYLKCPPLKGFFWGGHPFGLQVPKRSHCRTHWDM